MKRKIILFKYFFMTIALFLLVFVCSKTALVQAKTNTTLAKATPISIGSTVNGTFNGKNNPVYYYKITVPKDIGNQYITFSLTNYSNEALKISLCNQSNQLITCIDFIDTNENDYIRTRTDGAATTSTISKLIPGSTYYLQVTGSFSFGSKGDYVLSVTATPDDNWGTFDKATEIKCNQLKSGKFEYWDDIDCYYITLPKDKKKYKFIISADNETYALFANSNGIKISDTTISANSTDNSFSVIGNGQKIFVRMNSENSNTNYTLKVVSERKPISKLKLSKYKNGSKKIAGKTIRNATVKITVNKKTYIVKSNANGNFTVKLKKKLKSKQKIKISVSKANYKKKKKTFKVK